jgi:hypothetical protein
MALQVGFDSQDNIAAIEIQQVIRKSANCSNRPRFDLIVPSRSEFDTIVLNRSSLD